MEGILIPISFISGVIVAEYFLRPKKTSLFQELLSIFILLSFSTLIFEKTYYICKEALLPYSFFVGLSSASLSRILTFSFSINIRKKKRDKYKEAFETFIYELKKEGISDDKIVEICGRVGIGKRFARNVLKSFRKI